MRLSDILHSFIIVFLFIALASASVLIIQVEDIRNNWNEYKCNPMVVPFAGYFGYNSATTFAECVKDIQFDHMGTILTPLTGVLRNMGGAIENAVTSITQIQGRINDIVGNSVGMFGNVFGIFGSAMVNVRGLMEKMKDTFMKIIGVVVTIVYMVDTGVQTGSSAINGPIGKSLEFIDKLGGSCFHPDTLVTLFSGTVKHMKDVTVGDYLHDGSRVTGTMILDGNAHYISNLYNPYYRVNTGTHDVLVTGDHYIFDEQSKSFKKVKDLNYIIDSKEQTDTFVCLITDSHRISIGNKIFWDWEDNLIENDK